MVATAYDLPYDVMIGNTRDNLRGGDLRVSLVPRGSFSGGAAADLTSIVTTFDILAQTGALSGPAIPPWQSGIEIVEEEQNGRLDWRLLGCRLDERALVVLAQSFLLSKWRGDIARVEIGTPPYTRLPFEPETDFPYPTVWQGGDVSIVAPPGFSDSVRFIAQMRRTVTDEEVATLSNLLFNCATAIGMGLYGIAPIEPRSCTLQFEDSLEAIADELVLSLDKFRAHVSAVDAFLNVYLAFNHDRDVIARLEVE